MVSTLCCALSVALLATPASKTDPKTWSKHGAMGVKFGMGPEDVRAVYPDLLVQAYSEHVKSARSKRFKVPFPSKSWAAESHLQGEQVKVQFTFFKGRLSSMVVQPVSHRDLATWTNRIRILLEDKYGAGHHTENSTTEWSVEGGMTITLVNGLFLTYADPVRNGEAVAAADAWWKEASRAAAQTDQEKL
jgi:hypothetical protein